VAVRKVAITLPEELYELVERARTIEHRTRSELIQEALRTHFGEHVHTPTEAERRMLDEAVDELHREPDSGRPWEDVRQEIWPQS
jgi:metal-responsive CopG/Arc/MetJ family transcriptional regulator